MSNLTTTTSFNVGYYAGSPVIARSAEIGDTTLKVSIPFLDNTGAVVTGNYFLGIVTRDGIETVYVPEGAVSADGLTLSPVVRGIKPFRHTDIVTGDAAFAYKLAKGDRIFCALDTVLMTMLQEATTGVLPMGVRFAARPTFAAGAVAACPTFANAAARDAAIAAPQNGDSAYLIAEGVFTDYAGGVWVTRAVGTVVNASTAVAGKVEEADASEIAASSATGATGARLFVSPASVKEARTANESVLVRTKADTGALDHSFLSAACPVGTVLPFAGTTAPAGFLSCTGALVSRTVYSALFAVIGTTYGAGDGSTTFALPDLRGRTVIGSGTGTAADATAHTVGQAAGTETHLLTAAQSGLPGHSHPLFGVGQVSSGTPINTLYSTGSGVSTGTSTPQDASVAHPNMQPYLALSYIIRV